MKNFFEYMTHALEPLVDEQKRDAWDGNDSAFIIFSDKDQTGILAAGKRMHIIHSLAEAIMRDDETRRIVQSALRLARNETEKPTPQKFLLGESLKKPVN